MIPIEGLFEAHLSVRDFERSVAFYVEVVGLELGSAQPEHPAAFFWVGGRGRSMMGIFGVGSGTLPKQHHVAFQVRPEDALAAPQGLRSLGIAALGGHREPINEPIVFPWMPAHPYSSMTRLATSWNISHLTGHGQNRNRCHGR